MVKGDIISVFVSAFHGHLELVLAPVDLIDKFDGFLLSLIVGVGYPISQNLGPLKDIALVYEVEVLGKLIWA